MYINNTEAHISSDMAKITPNNGNQRQWKISCPAQEAMSYEEYQNIAAYERIVNELEQIYKDKNHDYGNSFSILFEKFGLTSVVIRLWDKILRLETLTKTEAKVKDESIVDTLKDIANYCIMTLAEIKRIESTGTRP